MKRVVYTALTGGYDSLTQHSYVDAAYDYICFTNDFDREKVGIWEIRRIPKKTEDIQRLSRYPKLQPHKLLQEYDYSIYVDANIDIKDGYIFERVEEYIRDGIKLAGLKHQLRDCSYEESLMVMLTLREMDVRAVLKQMSHYKRDMFPFHYGMYEANVIFRQHNNPLIQKQCNEWWYFQSHYSHRDQLGYPYTLWKNNIPFHYLLPENEWARNSQHISCDISNRKKKGILTRIYLKYMVKYVYAIIYPLYKKVII